ncbi:MAG: DNA-formamidopyrimidine glycosylase [Acidimicrobiales bacterium mtb01]|nr:bifunctional DNA-formamidopyrimidine glycosylase/DNA-(apurinic or apyrimidinic site) lyase [Actinomycetota bacterium]TEX45564.1 MAG: DNA-formamidopyrimidine glycosylase [Acidimicrobiales bacterium mtb01]
MPELPEVETVRRGLAERFVGRRVEHVWVGRERSVRRTSREELIARLSGATPIDAQRRGKYLLCPLDTGDVLMIHLRMSGQVLIDRDDSPRPLHTHVVLGIGAGEEFRFVDPRTFGEVVAYDPREAERVVPDVAALGVDPLVDELTTNELRSMLRSTRRGMKALLLDQHVIAGIGNIYGDEILHRAGISPLRPANRVTGGKVARLRDAVLSVLGDAVAMGGSTLGDAQYVDVAGEGGSFQENHRVYGRAGERCITCRRGVVTSAVVAGRTTSWCRVCQR